MPHKHLDFHAAGLDALDIQVVTWIGLKNPQPTPSSKVVLQEKYSLIVNWNDNLGPSVNICNFFASLYTTIDTWIELD